MPNVTNFVRSKAAVLMVVFLMAFSLFGGTISPVGTFAPTAAQANQTNPAGGNGDKHGVDSLWDTVADDGTSIGGELDSSSADLGTAVQTSKKVAQAITGILTVICFVSFLFWVSKLAMSAGNPQTRRVAISGILFSGIALALFGGAWVAVSFFWNLLSGVA